MTSVYGVTFIGARK